MPLNEENIFENVSLVVVNINNGTKKVLNMKIPFKILNDKSNFNFNITKYVEKKIRKYYQKLNFFYKIKY